MTMEFLIAMVWISVELLVIQMLSLEPFLSVVVVVAGVAGVAGVAVLVNFLVLQWCLEVLLVLEWIVQVLSDPYQSYGARR